MQYPLELMMAVEDTADSHDEMQHLSTRETRSDQLTAIKDRDGDDDHVVSVTKSPVHKRRCSPTRVLPPLIADSEFGPALQYNGKQDRLEEGGSTLNGPFYCVYSCLRYMGIMSQPPFYSDPVRRKQAGATSLPSQRRHGLYRYHALRLEEEDGVEKYKPDFCCGIEREHMTECTASFLESTWVFLLLLGILSSIMAWCVDVSVQILINWHTSFTALGHSWIVQYVLYTIFRVGLLLCGVLSTIFVCPNAAGSGIPEMRSILGGFPFPNYLRGRTLFAKAIGLILALGSGLSIGKEGPFVHLSSIIAHQLLRLPLFRQIQQSPDLTHHILSAACAVGVTSTFGTPIGGVLFSIEVTTTYYVTSNYWRAFFASVVGVVMFRLLNSLLQGLSGSLFTTDFDVLPYESYEMLWFLILAACCGLLAALFVRFYRFVVKLQQEFVAWYETHVSSKTTPFVYALFIALLFCLVEFPTGSFMQLSQGMVIDDMFSKGNLTHSTHLSKAFGTRWTHPSLALNLLAYICVRFLSTVMSATVMVPSGIVTPVFALGAAFGRLFGEMIRWFGGGHELAGGYAVVGAASFTAGVTGTVSIAVIVFELTSQLSYMVPVLLCVLIGRSIALCFSLDLYETISRQKNLPQWPDLTKQKSYGVIASDLMRSVPSYWVCRRQTLHSLQQVLSTTDSSVEYFPLVDDPTSMMYLGVAHREELELILEQWELCLSQQATRSRDARMASQVTLAGVSTTQMHAFSQSESIDLIQLGLLNLNVIHAQVHRDTFASHIILLISVHKVSQLFVTARGELLGVIYASDLLAQSRRATL